MEVIQQIIKLAYPVAVPIFFILLFIEIYIGYKDHKQSHELKDSLVSITTGLVFVGMGIFTKTIKILIFFWVYNNYRLFTIDYTWWGSWVILFVLEDFTFYWGHRMGHLVSFYWASHVVHHSSEHYNFSTAMRKTWTYDVTGHFLLWCWLPLIGFHPLHLMAVSTLSFIYQYWLHTEKVGFMPRWFEFIFNTPSHHRVHHSANLEYLDRNLGGVLIIFDRFFGTFQKEEAKCVYGLTKNIKTTNLLKVEFHEWQSLFKKAWRSNSFITGIKYLIKPPGWSPDGSSLTTKELRQQQQQDS
ncbi:MAG TPA: C-5 sterol desaturase [Microscillaceae bacterium]|nr:C-5 sterol desaturase [Microscillaceae bacterium]